MWEYFERLLQEKGVSIVEVSKATGIPQSTFSMWKSRKNTLSAENLLKLSVYFGVHIEYFLGANCMGLNDDNVVEQTEQYYVEDESKELAQFLFSNPEYRVLFDASRKIKPEDVKKAVKVLGVLSED